MEDRVLLLLRLQPHLAPHLAGLVGKGVAATPACSVVHSVSDATGSSHLVVAVTGAAGGAGSSSTSFSQQPGAEAVLQATAWLEQHAQAPQGLVDALQREGHAVISSAGASAAGNEPGGSSSGSVGRMQAQAVGAAAPSPAGPADKEHPVCSSTPLSSMTQVHSGTANSQLSAAEAGISGKTSSDDKQAPATTPQRLVPLLYRCGALESVVPVHSPEAQRALLGTVWSSLLAPVSAYRHYFGDQVGFYLAYMNALACWLIVPAVFGTFLLWGPLGSTKSHAAGLSSPLIPIAVLVQLLWCAAGIKLWRRHQALLRRQWHSGSASGTPTAPTIKVTNDPVAVARSGSSSSGGGGSSKGQGDSMSADHLRAGLPGWALQAPTATGNRWQFAGSWRRDASGLWQLQAPLTLQLLRLVASIAATGLLLLLAGSVLLACLNLQGLIVPSHTLLYVPQLAALSLPGAPLADGMLGQVPMVVRVLAVSRVDSYIFGPAARALTVFENRRTLEGFDASLTAKKAALQLLFTFVPVMYVGLAGAGAAAAANDAAGYFKFELLRRLVLEFAVPWVSLAVSARRKASGASGPTSQGSSGLSPSLQQAARDALRLGFDPFTGVWDVTRDIGYVMLFASILPWAAPLTLLYTLAKIKQECMALMQVYQRPMPHKMRSLGSWNSLLLVQVYLAVLTNTFLSGLSSGQLAQLLPSWLVPTGLADSLTAAAAARPSDSTAASLLGHAAAAGPMSHLVWSSQQGSAGLPAHSMSSYSCPLPMLWPDFLTATSPAYVQGRQFLQAPKLGAGATATQLQDRGLSTQAATSHLLLLFGIEHFLLLLVTLVLVLVPGTPDVPDSQPGPAQTTGSAGPTAPSPGITTHVRPESQGVQDVSAAAGAEGTAVTSTAHTPVLVHRNPLFSFSTARRSAEQL